MIIATAWSVQILGKKLVSKMLVKLKLSKAEMEERERFMVLRDIPELNDYREGKWQAERRRSRIHGLFFLMSLHQFGAEPTMSRKELLNAACAFSKEHFGSDWWKNHEDDKEVFSQEDQNPNLEWFQSFRAALLFACLNGDKSLLRILGNWPKSWMAAEWLAVPFPIGIEQLYFAIITAFQLGEVAPKSNKIDDKRIALLCGSLENFSKEKLASNLNDSLQLFVTRLKKKSVLPYEAIAVEETIIVLLAKLHGGLDLLSSIDQKYHHLLMQPPQAK
jgi:hypothetical protein